MASSIQSGLLQAPTTAPAADSTSAIAVDPDHSHESEAEEGSEIGSSTASLTESALEFRRLHGRTFQSLKSGNEYWGPNDAQQNKHLDINHEMLLLATGNKLFYAPVGDGPKRVLDVGTGTGIWAVDYADQFPDAEVIGTDVSPVHAAWVPPNCRFELEDAQLEWTYPDNHFDFIHIRLLMGAVADWDALYREAYRCLKPGGWIEHLEYDPHLYSDDGSIAAGSALERWGPLFIEAGDKVGRTFGIIRDSANLGWLEKAGFRDLGEKRLKLPLGGWPRDPSLKTIGHFNLEATEQGLEGFALYILSSVHGWDLESIQAYLAAVRKGIRSSSSHTYYVVATAMGQKPLSG